MYLSTLCILSQIGSLFSLYLGQQFDKDTHRADQDEQDAGGAGQKRVVSCGPADELALEGGSEEGQEGQRPAEAQAGPPKRKSTRALTYA